MNQNLAVFGFSLIMFIAGLGSLSVFAEDYETRSIDGTQNNQVFEDYGNAGIPLIRIASVGYSDGIEDPSGENRPSARVISNTISNQTESVPNQHGLSSFFWQWGQFLDHDISLTPPGDPPERFDIEVIDDPLFGDTDIVLVRSKHNGGNTAENPRQQINDITSFIDASNVYGSDEIRANALRDNDGRLKTSDENYLPYNESGLPNDGHGDPADFYLAGDVRANESIGLITMHTLFVREHNRIAQEISQNNPDLDGESIYQHTRKIVGAQMQVITYNEFIPELVGTNEIPKYSGYDPDVNPGIANEFSTSAFRFGHSTVPSNVIRIMDDGTMKEILLRDAFFNPGLVQEDDGIESILRGLAAQKAQELDTLIVDDLRNFLFGPPGSGGFDLMSLNIQRSRDHGLPDYNTVRESYGLPRVNSFEEITSDKKLQQKLESLYGNVDNIDLTAGLLAEDHVPGGTIGETGKSIIVDQFVRLRDGDRFWYQNDPFFVENKQLMKEVEKTKLSDIIKRNTSIEGDLAENVFKCKNLKWHSDKKLHLCH